MTDKQKSTFEIGCGIAAKLPSNIVWSFTTTNEEGDAVFNIYVEEQHWHKLRLLLGLGEPEDRESDFQSWTCGGVTLSLVAPEEQQDGRDEPAGPAAA